MMLEEVLPDRLPHLAEARCAKRQRALRLVEQARERRPTLRIERLEPILNILWSYRTDPEGRGPAALSSYVAEVQTELRKLETWARKRSPRSQANAATIRRALCFLRAFGRISSLDFDNIPIEERKNLIALLNLEYRWCFASAGTTPEVFKLAVGRSGAR